ncbi:MAG: hypothetical protein UEA60_08995 [Lachnospiraceae bacterium]|nr:hypothetical protein [Lachnospiraceae bacterium]
MYEKHETMFEPTDNKAIWKYMSFSKFTNMLSGSMYFNRIDSFEDVFEGHWPKINIKCAEYLKEKMNKDICAFDEVLRKMTYVSCFHKSNYETAFMWKQYSNDDGLAIKTSLQRLKDAFNITEIPIYISDVHYIDYATEYIEDISNMFSLAIHKRKSFEFEQEIRCVCIMNYADDKGNILEQYRSEEEFNRIDLNKMPKGIKVPIDLSILLEKIYISPYAPEYLEENIRMLIDKFGINAEVVRSDLYKIQ